MINNFLATPKVQVLTKPVGHRCGYIFALDGLVNLQSWSFYAQSGLQPELIFIGPRQDINQTFFLIVFGHGNCSVALTWANNETTVIDATSQRENQVSNTHSISTPQLASQHEENTAINPDLPGCHLDPERIGCDSSSNSSDEVFVLSASENMQVASYQEILGEAEVQQTQLKP